jgi:hypothetical protein
VLLLLLLGDGRRDRRLLMSVFIHESVSAVYLHYIQNSFSGLHQVTHLRRVF